MEPTPSPQELLDLNDLNLAANIQKEQVAIRLDDVELASLAIKVVGEAAYNLITSGTPFSWLRKGHEIRQYVRDGWFTVAINDSRSGYGSPPADVLRDTRGNPKVIVPTQKLLRSILKR